MRSMLRPACTGMVSEVAWARNARQRSTVRSSSRSISATESDTSATRIARRWRPAAAGERARLVGDRRRQCLRARGAHRRRGARARPRRAAPACGRRARAAPAAPGATARATPPRARCRRGWRFPCAAAPARCAPRWPRSPASRARRSSSSQMRVCTRCAPRSSRRSASSRTVPVRRRSRRSRTEAWFARIARNTSGDIDGEQRLPQRHGVGEARLAVDRRVHAEQLARGRGRGR